MPFVWHSRRSLVGAVCIVPFAVALLFVTLVGCGDIGDVAAPPALAAVVPVQHGPFCLTTEFYPIPSEHDAMFYPLLRELGRQAMLIAARDGLGLATRDETLGEGFPVDAETPPMPFEFRVRVRHSGTAELSLQPGSSHDATGQALPGPLECEFQFQNDTYNMYTALAIALGQASRGQLVDMLRQSGFEGEAVKVNEDAPLPEGVEAELAEMNFVSQYGAVRKIHEAIARDGESPARLGGLARGYAHLDMLTRHHWNRAATAFAARALLYAERLIALSDDQRLAHQHRAYVRALVGLHGMALQDLDRLPPDERAADAQQAALPWTKIIEPFCRFEEDELRELRNEQGLNQLVPQLVFEMVSRYCDERRNTTEGPAAAKACPESYGIYSVLANDAPMLIERQAVQYAAESFGRQIPRRVARLEALPDSVQVLVRDEVGAKNSWLSQWISGEYTSKFWSAVPGEIAEALRDPAINCDDTSEPSWQVLAALIAEEQFVEIANYLKVSSNAVEYSKKDLVERFAPLVEGHQYAPYIGSYAVSRGEQSEQVAQFAAQITVRDPKPQMQRMINHFWSAQDANGKCFSDYRSDTLWRRDYHLPDLAAALQNVDSSWWQQSDLLAHFQSLAEDMRWISPYAPHTLRLELETTSKPTDVQLVDWEKRGQNDPIALSRTAGHFNKRKDFDAAARCYKRSYQLSPTSTTAIGLATAYRALGQEEKWLPALEAYLQEDDYSLGHASIHQHIAKDYMAKEKWVEAEPHALAAAETWSAWGLLLAAQVYEGLGDWEESERWYRETSNNYTSSSGHHWYLWCRRTGRGEVDSARKLFDRYLRVDWVQKAGGGENYPFVDDVLEGRYQQALNRLLNWSESSNDVYWQMHVALLAKRLGNDELYADSMNQLVQMAEEQYREKDPKYFAFITLMQKLQQQSKLDDADFETIDESLAAFADWGRCNCCYFIGEQLALHGFDDRAEGYWRRSLATGQTQKYNTTFAGARLVELYGTSRPDEEVDAAEDSL